VLIDFFNKQSNDYDLEIDDENISELSDEQVQNQYYNIQIDNNANFQSERKLSKNKGNKS